MQEDEGLVRARRAFAARVALVRPEHLSLPTPCSEWDVRALLAHVVGGDHGYVALLRGGTAAELEAHLAGVRLHEQALPAQFDGSSAQVLAAFAAPGALQRTVHHPSGDLPGVQLRAMKVVEWTVHAWDLARALGADDALDPVLAERLLDGLLPFAPSLASTGAFAAGTGVATRSELPVQRRLLDLLGRGDGTGP